MSTTIGEKGPRDKARMNARQLSAYEPKSFVPVLPYATVGAKDSELLALRQYAYAVDYLIWMLLGRALVVWCGVRDYFLDHLGGYAFFAGTIVVLLVWRTVFLCKDGLAGYSPGKWVFGLRVFRMRDGRPVGVIASLKRNLLLFVPILGEFVVWLQMRTTGKRPFDAWANCKVVRMR